MDQKQAFKDAAKNTRKNFAERVAKYPTGVHLELRTQSDNLLIMFDEAVRKYPEYFEVEDELPLCYQSGDWDGKRSDFVIGIDKDDVPHIVRLYSGFMDGNEFADWYNVDEFEVHDIVKWCKIPE